LDILLLVGRGIIAPDTYLFAAENLVDGTRTPKRLEKGKKMKKKEKNRPPPSLWRIPGGETRRKSETRPKSGFQPRFAIFLQNPRFASF
jgi:hypothetical protein